MKKNDLYICDFRTETTFHMKKIDRNTADRIFLFCDLESDDYLFVYSRKEAKKIGFRIEELRSH